MNPNDCGAPLSRRLVKVDGAWALELRNNSETEISELHIVHVFFRDDWQDGKPTIRITFGDIPLLASKESVIAKHTTYFYDENHTSKDDMWRTDDPNDDRLILLNEQTAKTPIGLDAQFVMNGENCYQELRAGQGSGLTLDRGLNSTLK